MNWLQLLFKYYEDEHIITEKRYAIPEIPGIKYHYCDKINFEQHIFDPKNVKIVEDVLDAKNIIPIEKITYTFHKLKIISTSTFEFFDPSFLEIEIKNALKTVAKTNKSFQYFKIPLNIFYMYIRLPDIIDFYFFYIN